MNAGCLNWNGYYEQRDDTVKYASTNSLHHDNKNDTTVHHAKENEFMQKKQTDNLNERIIMCGFWKDGGQDLMSTLDIYFSHVADHLSDVFNVFCSIVAFVVTVG